MTTYQHYSVKYRTLQNVVMSMQKYATEWRDDVSMGEYIAKVLFALQLSISTSDMVGGAAPDRNSALQRISDVLEALKSGDIQVGIKFSQSFLRRYKPESK